MTERVEWPSALVGTPAVTVIESAITRQRLSHSLLLHGDDLPTLVLAAIFAFHGSAVLARAASPDPAPAMEECRGDLPVPEASFSAPPLAAPARPSRASPPLAKNRCAAANRLNSAR